MKINTKIRYGIRMLVMLARAKEVINTVELGRLMNVSPKYLRKLAGPLEKNKLIESVQGIYGGYKLKKTPAEISINSIFKAFKENFDISICVDDGDCNLFHDCITRPLWEHLNAVIARDFYSVTIQNILDRKF